MPSKEDDIKTVAGFVSRILGGLALGKQISMGLGDMGVLAAFGRLAPVDYPSVLKALANAPGVTEFINKVRRFRGEEV